MNMRLAILTLLAWSFSLHASPQYKGLIRPSIVTNDAQPSFLDKGTGTFRTSDTELSLSQFLIELEHDLFTDVSLHVVANAYDDGDKQLGFTQAFVSYNPLSANKYKFRGRVGFFYPALSVENTDIGWLAQNFITSSAINAWIGEELRVPGIEVSVKRPGKRFNSPWSWQFDAAAYRGNDTIGALLAWKGFGIHDRQTLHHENRVEFAPIPSVSDVNGINSPTYTDPFTEIDGRVGYYFGLKAQYLRKLDIRYYYYNNQADPLILNEERLYSWYTVFNSVAMRYLINASTEWSFHFLDGLTEMGEQIVFVDITAFYTAISHSFDANRLSARLDIFDVSERDKMPDDPNNSNGIALTLNWTRHISSNTEIALETIVSKNTVANRATLDIAPTQNVLQLQLAFTQRF